MVTEAAYVFFFVKRDLPMKNNGDYDLLALKQDLPKTEEEKEAEAKIQADTEMKDEED